MAKRFNVCKILVAILFSLVLLKAVQAQDSNVLHPTEEIEQKLWHKPFEIFRIRGLRFEDDITKRAILRYDGNQMLQVKWRQSAEGGWGVNNEPRYELAAYVLQKLFLDEMEFVVPPTAIRVLPVFQYVNVTSGVSPTFKGTQDVFFVLQYWLEQVSMDNIYDKKRFESDSLYARHFANMNILTYLIEHKDSNRGNVLISSDPANPRLFAVDNGFSFQSPESNRGDEWRDLKVDKLPQKTVERLRKITRSDLDNALAVVAQFEMRDGFLTSVPVTAKIDKKRGVQKTDEVIQFGLTEFELEGLERRLKHLLEKVDSGKIETF